MQKWIIIAALATVAPFSTAGAASLGGSSNYSQAQGRNSRTDHEWRSRVDLRSRPHSIGVELNSFRRDYGAGSATTYDVQIGGGYGIEVGRAYALFNYLYGIDSDFVPQHEILAEPHFVFLFFPKAETDVAVGVHYRRYRVGRVNSLVFQPTVIQPFADVFTLTLRGDISARPTLASAAAGALRWQAHPRLALTARAAGGKADVGEAVLEKYWEAGGDLEILFYQTRTQAFGVDLSASHLAGDIRREWRGGFGVIAKF